jgi:large subunit ribosomal protein L19
MAKQIKILDKLVNVGDEIFVHNKIREKGKERIQVFKGLVISIKAASGNDATFIVRRIANGNIGVERIWPVKSPLITKIEINHRGNVRRAKLFYLRNRIGKQANKVDLMGQAVDAEQNPGEIGGKSSPQISSK